METSQSAEPAPNDDRPKSRDDRIIDSLKQEAKGKHIAVDMEDLIRRIEKDTGIDAFLLHYDESASQRLFAPLVITIDNVPENLRNLNEDAYSPRVVSIGPLHYGRLHSNFIRYKNECMFRYLHESNVNAKDIARLVVKSQEVYRYAYSRVTVPSTMSSQDFFEMIMKDHIVMIELLLDNQFPPEEKIFTNAWINRDILHDMLLHENQIPCEQLLHDLFSNRNSVKPLHELIHYYFQDVGNMVTFRPKENRYFHLLDLLREYHFPQLESIEEGKGNIRCKFSAKQLQEAGVEFVKADPAGMPLMDIKFSGEGILTIPQLIVNEWSETFYLNVIAFERANNQKGQYACSYFIFMESLIKTDEDVDLLVGHHIIENFLGDAEQVRSLFANLRKDIPMKDFYLSSRCNDLNMYSRNWWHQWKGAWYGWKRMLRRNYFSNPWSAISVVAAVILLSLTVIQTVCSVISL